MKPFHPHLERQIKKYLGDNARAMPELEALLHAVSNSYASYERDRELHEHAFSINEQEYHQINNELRQLASSLEDKIQERTQELEDVARFPMENPNPVYRISNTGEIIFTNHTSEKIRSLVFEGKKYNVRSFFKKIVAQLEKAGSFDIQTNDISYLFTYKHIEERGYYNFYSTDITEKNQLRKSAQQNYQRLKNFLENTNDAYYIIYKKHRKKNFITGKWAYFFGFDSNEHNDLIKTKSDCVISEKKKEHHKRLIELELGEKINIKYQAINQSTGETFWLSEVVTKQYDVDLDDIVISGRISDITKEHYYELQIKESETRFRNLIEALPVMVWVSDDNNKVSFCNKAFRDFFKFDLKNINNSEQFLKLIHPEDRDRSAKEWEKGLKRKQPIDSSFRMKAPDGNYLNIFEKAVPRYLSDNVFTGYIGCMFDLTQEKQFQQKLELEKHKLELLTKNSPDIVLLADQRGHIEYVSGTIKKVLGYSEAEVIGRNIREFICKECKQHLHKTPWLFDFKNKIQKYEYRMTSKTGKDIWVESVLSVIKNQDDAGYKILMHNRDIDALKKAEISLTEREQKYRGIFENMNLGVMEVDLDEKIVWVNESFENMTGYSLKYLKGKSAVDVFLMENSTKKFMDKVMHKRIQRNESIYEISMKKNKGELIDVVISGSPVLDIFGNVRGSVGIHWDVTELRRIERMLEEEKTNKQNEIMRATIEGEEKQKLQIGHELHDGVGHLLTYTSLLLQVLSQDVHVKPEQVSKVHVKVEEALQEVKRLSKNLIPPALNDLGLKEALIELFNQQHMFMHTKFKLQCSAADLKDLDLNAQRNIYRMVQELVNNTLKHTKSTLVGLTIRRNKETLSIHYHNDGKAFNPAKIKKGIGLNSILNRTTFYNGKMDITSGPKTGADFRFELPLKNMLNHD